MERWFSHGFILKTITIGEHRKDNKKLKPKIHKKHYCERWFLRKIILNTITMEVYRSDNKEAQNIKKNYCGRSFQHGYILNIICWLCQLCPLHTSMGVHATKIGSRACIPKMFFLFFISSSIAGWHCRMTSTKVKTSRSVWGLLLNRYPPSLSYHHHEAIGGTVYILRLEKADWIEEELCQEFTLSAP